jgi:hypothetical protein
VISIRQSRRGRKKGTSWEERVSRDLVL